MWLQERDYTVILTDEERKAYEEECSYERKNA